MEAQKFIATAQAQISSNPLDRVSEHINNIKDTAIFDPHCHIFDRQCVPLGYFVLRLLTKLFVNTIAVDDNLLDNIGVLSDNKANELVGITVEDLYERLKAADDITDEKIDTEIKNEIAKNEVSVKVDKAEINAINIQISTNKDKDGVDINQEAGSNLNFKLEILKRRKERKEKTISGLQFILNEIFSFKTNKEIFELYLNQFAIKNLSPFKESGKPFITGILMMDIQPGWENKRQKKSITEQIEELLNLTQEMAETNNPIIPFFAVDPRRADSEKENLYDLFLKAFPREGTSFFGVKIYPSLGYLPSDARLRPIYEICQAKNIPVLTHCGGSFVTTFEQKTSDKLRLTQNFDVNDKVEIEFKDRHEMGNFLNQPEHWLSVLKAFPNLKLNIAHFGSPTAWNGSLPDEIVAVDTNHENFKTFNIASRKNTIIALMKQFRGVYADFSFNITEANTFTNLLEELDTNSVVKERTMFGTDFWVVLSNTLFFKDKLNPAQQNFIQRFSNHRSSLFSEVPKNFLFDTIADDIDLAP